MKAVIHGIDGNMHAKRLLKKGLTTKDRYGQGFAKLAIDDQEGLRRLLILHANLQHIGVVPDRCATDDVHAGRPN